MGTHMECKPGCQRTNRSYVLLFVITHDSTKPCKVCATTDEERKAEPTIHQANSSNWALAIEQSRQKNAGWTFVTDLGQPNPYGHVPTIWAEEVKQIAAECP